MIFFLIYRLFKNWTDCFLPPVARPDSIPECSFYFLQPQSPTIVCSNVKALICCCQSEIPCWVLIVTSTIDGHCQYCAARDGFWSLLRVNDGFCSLLRVNDKVHKREASVIYLNLKEPVEIQNLI